MPLVFFTGEKPNPKKEAIVAEATMAIEGDGCTHRPSIAKWSNGHFEYSGGYHQDDLWSFWGDEQSEYGLWTYQGPWGRFIGRSGVCHRPIIARRELNVPAIIVSSKGWFVSIPSKAPHVRREYEEADASSLPEWWGEKEHEGMAKANAFDLLAKIKNGDEPFPTANGIDEYRLQVEAVLEAFCAERAETLDLLPFGGSKELCKTTGTAYSFAKVEVTLDNANAA